MGGKDTAKRGRRVLKSLISRDLAAQMSWLGSKNVKLAFANTKIHSGLFGESINNKVELILMTDFYFRSSKRYKKCQSGRIGRYY